MDGGYEPAEDHEREQTERSPGRSALRRRCPRAGLCPIAVLVLEDQQPRIHGDYTYEGLRQWVSLGCFRAPRSDFFESVVLEASLDVGIALILIQGSLPSSWSPLNNGAPATQLPSFKFHDFQQPSVSGCPDFPTARLAAGVAPSLTVLRHSQFNRFLKRRALTEEKRRPFLGPGTTCFLIPVPRKDKLLTARPVVGSVTTSESLVLYVFASLRFFLGQHHDLFVGSVRDLQAYVLR
jgi:hypothetical protein